MLTVVFCISAMAAVLAGGCGLLAFGLRNGDQAGDARVTARLSDTLPAAGHRSREDARPLIVAAVRNPSGTPVLVALRVRRAVVPAWLAGPYSVTVPRLTVPRLTVPGRAGGGRLRPERFAEVGIVVAAGAAGFTLAVPPRARHCLLTVAVGQEGGRLRWHRLRLGPVCYTMRGADDPIMIR